MTFLRDSDSFTQVLGLKINFIKSNMVWIGSKTQIKGCISPAMKT